MLYRIFGWWYRWQACKLAAVAMQGTAFEGGERTLMPITWSLTVFFETYMLEGADGTSKEFGPKEPVELKAEKT